MSINLDPKPWSYTRLKNARYCPALCHLVCSGAVPRIKVPKRIETIIGNQIHELLEMLIKGKDGFTVGRYEKLGNLTDNSWRAIPARCLVNCYEFVHYTLPDLQKLVPEGLVYCERKIDLGNELQPVVGRANTTLTGKIDLFTVDPKSEKLLIVDFKSYKEVLEEDLLEFRLQLLVYTLLIYHGFCAVKKIAWAVFNPITNDFSFYTGTEDNPFIDIKEVIAQAETFVRQNIALAEEVLFNPVPMPNRYCIYCDFRGSCSMAKGE